MQDPPPVKTLYLALLQWSGIKPALSLRYACILNKCSDWQCKERNQGESVIWAGFRSLNSILSHWEGKSRTSLGRNGTISALKQEDKVFIGEGYVFLFKEDIMKSNSCR